MWDILLPVLILVGIGLVAAVLLVIASAVMSVKTDETVAELTEALPGINCGACGYSGCSGYAQALAKGGKDGSVKTNLKVQFRRAEQFSYRCHLQQMPTIRMIPF